MKDGRKLVSPNVIATMASWVRLAIVGAVVEQGGHGRSLESYGYQVAQEQREPSGHGKPIMHDMTRTV